MTTSQRFQPHKRARAVELPCRVSDVIYSAHSRPNKSYIDLVFQFPSKVNYLVFRNYFTYTITIQHFANAEDEGKEVLKGYKLMNSPQCENDAHNYHCIDVSKQFCKGFDTYRVSHLRIYLVQPSPHWIDHYLTDIKAYVVAEYSPKVPPPSSLPQTAISSASDVLSLAKSIKSQRTEYKKYDTFCSYLNKKSLESVVATAADAEIVELR
eukprot:TRINITY_DN9876_c0_g1_i2.p1 TRINITY_DN9876_c0_g1~~TRINITY_DN9876_c0_g1_i2.p1  ORF type:complete len:210 (+),score=17.88 TRINITY_DN9876_c0_g1_i2:120-749(+)